MNQRKNISKRKVLVTGGAGFIGSHLVDRLVATDHQVFILDDLSGGFIRNINPSAQFFACDLRDVNKTASYIESIAPEVVFHLAANAAENKAQFSPIDITSRNYNAFINTLVPAIRAGMKRIIVTSSIAVYGSGLTRFKEDTEPHPHDLYGVSKYAMEKTLEILAKVHSFEYVITRPHNVYGPRQNMSDPYRNVVTLFMNSLLRKQPYYIYGDGEQRRCFSYIDDVVKDLFTCLNADVSGMTFNIGSDKEYTINQLSQEIQKIAGVTSKVRFLNERPQEVKVVTADHTQARKFLGFNPETSLKKGLMETWKYAQKLGPQEPIFTQIELESKLLPSNWKK